MQEIDRECRIRGGRIMRLPFGTVGGVGAIAAQEGQPARVKLFIEVPGGVSGERTLSLGTEFALADGTWTVAEITSAGSGEWSARLQRTG
ncbi:DUF6406 domain-containing protein [Streptomyces sp. NPDC047981]|uniref:DUF6406 domain-containing protein n=1 Tax=Streptomyces sp. NPDC047981 TaxID=3154610 RepID=UPI003422246E